MLIPAEYLMFPVSNYYKIALFQEFYKFPEKM